LSRPIIARSRKKPRQPDRITIRQWPPNAFCNKIVQFRTDAAHALDLATLAIPAAGGMLAQLSQLGEKNEQYQCRHSESLHYTALAGRRAIFSGAVIRGGFCGGRSSLSERARSFWSAVISV